MAARSRVWTSAGISTPVVVIYPISLMGSPGPGSGRLRGDLTPMTTSICQSPSRMPIARALGHTVRKTRRSLFGCIARSFRAQPAGDLVGEPRHLERVEFARTGDIDVPDLCDPAGTRCHEHDPVAEAHRLAHVVGDEDDRLAGFLPDAVQVVVQLVTGQSVERGE